MMTAPTSRQLVSRLRAGRWSQADDELAEEVPVALEYNGIAYTATRRRRGLTRWQLEK
jgi:formate dehydrogenase assembly factor FdhD